MGEVKELLEELGEKEELLEEVVELIEKPEKPKEPLKNKGRIVLDNGLTVLWQKSPSRTITANLSVGIGGLDDPDGKEGAFHFIEHTLYEGTENFTDDEIKKVMSELGIPVISGTSLDKTVIPGSFSPEDLNLYLKLASEFAFKATFNREGVEKERKIVLRELEFYESQPDFRLSRLFLETLYVTHPVRRLIGGTKQSVKGITRNDLYENYRQMYVPNNMTLALVGNLPDDTLERVEECFGEASRRKLPKREYKKEEKLNSIRTSIKREDDLTETFIDLGFPTVGRYHEDIYALEALSYILGGPNFDSRLQRSIREKGYAYTVSSGYERFDDIGFLVISTKISPEKRDEVVGIILDEIQKLREEPVTEYEVKSFRKTSSLIRDKMYETDKGRMSILLFEEKYGMSIDEHTNRLLRVTPDDIMRVANKYLDPERYALAVLEPKSYRPTVKEPSLEEQVPLQEEQISS